MALGARRGACLCWCSRALLAIGYWTAGGSAGRWVSAGFAELLLQTSPPRPADARLNRAAAGRRRIAACRCRPAGRGWIPMIALRYDSF